MLRMSMGLKERGIGRREMAIGMKAANALAARKQVEKIGHKRRYETLCRVLDSICAEAPQSLSLYHPPSTNRDAQIQARSRALLHLYLKAKFGLINFDDRERYITDGRFDGGIDAYFIDKRSKHIHILQAKFRATAENFASSDITASDLLKMDVARILKGGEKKDEQGNRYNDRILRHLVKDFQQVPDIANYTTKVVVLGNNRLFTLQQIGRLVEGYPVDQLPHDRLYSELMFPVVNGTYFSDPDLTIEIFYEGNLQQVEHYVKADGLETKIALYFVPTKEIGRIMNLYKNSLLKYNPRSFLELSKNEVNKQIEASIRSTAGNNFALFNNGVTIISDSTKVSSDTARRGIGQIFLTNPQLINGGQTAYTLATIFADCLRTNDFNVFKGKQVLLRVITFTARSTAANSVARSNLIAAISRASNSQTNVDESDRRSNDLVQMRLQAHFFEEFGLFYERKKGESSDGISSGYIDRTLLINRDKLVRVALATDNKSHLARSSIKKYFAPGALPSLFKESHVAEYAYGYEVLQLVEVARRAKPATRGDRFNTLLYGQGLRLGQYALVAACTAQGFAAGKTPKEALQKVLAQWKKFETFAERRKENKDYKLDGAFEYTNYYKGPTVGQDLRGFNFVF